MKALLFDTETNGLIENRALRLDRQPEIFEWYSCLVDLATDTLIEDLEFMCKPKRTLEEQRADIDRRIEQQARLALVRDSRDELVAAMKAQEWSVARDWAKALVLQLEPLEAELNAFREHADAVG